MREQIKKILKEEAEMTEMGISLSKLKASQPKNYLVRSLIKKEKSAEKKKELMSISNKCNELFKKIDYDLKTLNWQDLSFSEQGGFFYIVLPQKIKSNVEKLTSLYEVLDEVDYTIGLNPKNKIEAFIMDSEDIADDNIYMYIDEPRNRTHFPQGLPPSLLGYNLGYKIYRKLLSKLGFIQSESNASREVQEVYRKLLQSPDINCVVYNDSVLLIEDELPKEQVIMIVSESIYDKYYNGRSKKLVLGKSIILNSKLLRMLGQNKVERLINELFNLYEDLHEPFSSIGYKMSK